MTRHFIRFAAALVFALISLPALAQWQVPANAVPTGRGTGTGFHYAPTGTAGRLFIDLGAGTDPAFVALTGDCGITSGGIVTCTKINGTAIPSAPSTNTVPVVTSANQVTWEKLPNAALANPSTTVNGTVCTLGSTCSPTAPASGITVGTTTITSGSSGNIEFNNAGVLGEKATTGSGNVVLATSPTLVTPALGTPTAITLTSGTGLPVSTGISGLGTGIAAWLATPSSANLATALTDETGSGAAVFGTSPTLTTPALGTPSALVGTNISGTGASFTAGHVTTNANLTGPITSVGNATSIASQTGTGTKFVVDTSPTLVTPNLGTPSAVTLTSGTGLPISTGVSGLGTGIAAWLATPSSANLATALTDETGSGAAVFGTSPTLTTPALGTPSAVVLTSATGLPLTSGVTGQLPIANGGSSQSTAVAARGSSGFNIDHAVTHGDSDYTVPATDRTSITSATFTALRTWTLPAANAVTAGQHVVIADMFGAINGANTLSVARAGADTINGVSSVAITAQYGYIDLVSDGSSKWTYAASSGGGGGSGTVTNATIAAGTGIGVSGTCSITTSGTCTVALSTPVAVANGGTGISSFGSGVATWLGTPSSANLASALTDESGTGAAIFAGSPALTGTPTAPTQSANNNSTAIATTAYVDATKPTLGTPVASTSGTSIDFTGIPSTATRIQVNFAGISTNGTSAVIIQIGDSGGVETTGYLGVAGSSGTFTSYTTGAGLYNGMAAAFVMHGTVTISLENATLNTWVFSGTIARSDFAEIGTVASSKSLSPGPLDRVRITTLGGTNTFDAGSVNISYQ